MNERMKVMVAYDGSAYADAALDDLRRAGLPREVSEFDQHTGHGGGTRAGIKVAARGETARV
ncbi:MAG TPA: hypothetical protein VFY67_10830 [Pyrinomonadaceae bacterium]|nr:hypothetical protein [Pyrinomonadaceae bacterium]